jgi:hypothetical protein
MQGFFKRLLSFFFNRNINSNIAQLDSEENNTILNDDGSISERFIQRISIDYLADKYSKSGVFRKSIYKNAEEYTTEGNRVDGLIVYKKSFRRYKTVAIEAKSRKYKEQVHTKFDEEKWQLHRNIYGAMTGLIIVIITIFFICNIYVILILITFFLLVYSRLFLEERKKRYITSDAFCQIKKYRANFQWLALPNDCIEDYDKVISFYTKRNIGVIIFNKEGKLIQEHKAIEVSGRFLKFYKNSSHIKKILNTNSR